MVPFVERFPSSLGVVVVGIVMCLTGSAWLVAQPSSETGIGISSNKPIPNILSLGLEIVPSPSGGSFFSEYARLGTQQKSLEGYAMPTLSLRVQIFESTRFVIHSGFGRNSFTDIYSVLDSTAPSGGSYSSFVESFKSSAIPILLGLEYVPLETQFTSYAGVGVGIAITSIDWTTSTQLESRGELSRPDFNVSGTGFSPAGRVYAGVDYRFDAAVKERNTLRGIYLEGAYMMIPIKRDFFTAIRRNGRGLPQAPTSDSAVLEFGGVTLTLGVSLQFDRK